MENATPPHRGLKSQIVETLNLAEVMCPAENHFEICESNSSMNVDADAKNWPWTCSLILKTMKTNKYHVLQSEMY